MKILIYSLGLPPFRRGGLVNYTVDLASQLVKNGYKVSFLYPGKMPLINNKKLKFEKKSTDFNFDCYELINPLPVSLTFGNSVNASAFYASRDKEAIRKFISKINPDVVHFHTIMGLPIEFLEVLKEKNIKTIYTTHDYYGLCPKMLSSNTTVKLRSTSCSLDCLLCKVGPSVNKIRLMQSHFYQRYKNSKIVNIIRNNQRKKASINDVNYDFNSEQIHERYLLRKYYLRIFSLFDSFHFNSSVARDFFIKYLPNANGLVVPLVLNGLPNSYPPKTINNSDKVVIGFLGGMDKKKGFFLLKKIIPELERKNKGKFSLLCAGSNSSDSFFDSDYVSNLGIIPRDKIDDFYKRIDVLVVPSQWHETFGLVVLEAIARNTPVICSDIVGAKDILPSDFVFHDKKDLLIILNELLNSQEKRLQFLKLANELKISTDFNSHVKRIQQIFYK